MSAVRILSAGLTAPGLPDWETAKPVLAGSEAPVAEPLAPFKPTLLPANERRRTTRTIKLALKVAQEATEGLDLPADELASVLASSCGDTEVAVRICESLAQAGRPVSPIQFHNSVHNAAAGYWSIAWQSTAPSVSLSAYDWSFATGLLEAVTQILGEGRTVLLAAYDLPAPAPLSEVRPMAGPFGAAFVLGPAGNGEGPGLGSLKVGLRRGEGETCLESAELEALRLGNPAGRSLPLLQAVAEGRSRSLSFAYSPESHLALEYQAP